MDVQKALESQLTQVVKIVEDQVDAEIAQLEKMDEDDFEVLRQRRMQALKKAQEQKQQWMAIGHGKYEEIAEEKDFFDVCKKSKNVVCHFYRESTFRCKIVDKHLAILAPKHIEARFVKIDAEKCPFLVQRLKIKVLPTLCLSRDAKTVDYIVGFDDLGGTDEFSTEMMEWRIAQADVINYSGDLGQAPNAQGKKSSILQQSKKKTIRSNRDDSSSDEDF